ncbi:MAG TPA: hypothetical protein VL244_16965, partial [Alphaproteobacteria bacterium]|nr:hypothetical protein [Alphaproteobacteria bacterium]
MAQASTVGTKLPTTEVVGRFAERGPFKTAVEALLAAGFERGDLSVLDSHDSLAAAEGRNEAWRRTLAGLVGEVKYLEPITAAGLILLASGVVGAELAGVLAAGLGGMAVFELLGKIRATPHTREFATALEHGAVLLWVGAETPERQRLARDILTRHAAADVHIHTRAPH